MEFKIELPKSVKFIIDKFKENGFESIYTKCDLQGFERVVIGFYNN